LVGRSGQQFVQAN